MTAREQFKHYLDVLYRRKWWIVVPVVLSVVGCYVLLQRLPKIYRATTMILVTPQRLPEDFVRTTVTTQVEDRMATLAKQILSRAFLEKVARELGLIAEGAEDAQVEGACARLRRRVELDSDRRDFTYFEVSVDDESPQLAARIANRLAELFIEQNSLVRSAQASGTLSTVEGWLEKKKVALDAMEARIAFYRRGNLWELPEQLNANLRLLESAQQQVANLTKDIQMRDDRLGLLRAQEQTQTSFTTVITGVAPDVDPAVRRLGELENELAQLRVTYTEENPVVRRKIYEIEEHKKRHPGLGQVVPSTPGEPAPLTGIKAEMERIKKEVRNLEEERARVQNQIAVYGARINSTPAREQELSALTRDYGTLKAEYDDLLSKREQAARAEELEASKNSEQFTVQDPARPPNAPYKPKPLELGLMCLMVGVGVGAGFAMLLEFLDQTVRNEEDFRQAFPDLPLLSAIPHLDLPGRGPGGGKGVPDSRHAAMLVILVTNVVSVAWKLGGWIGRTPS